MAKREYVNPRELLGGTIESIIPVPDAHGSPYSVVMIVSTAVRKRGGKMVRKVFHCETWRDPEGNGPGFMYVEDLDKDSAADDLCPHCQIPFTGDHVRLCPVNPDNLPKKVNLNLQVS